MLNFSFTPPETIQASVLTRLPDAFRQARRTDWVDANKPGAVMDSFLEGPSFDRAGNLYVTDIPYGRIFKISPALGWTLWCSTMVGPMAWRFMLMAASG